MNSDTYELIDKMQTMLRMLARGPITNDDRQKAEDLAAEAFDLLGESKKEP